VSPVGLTKDVGWNVGVSRTLPHDPDHVWATLVSPDGLAVWLGEGAQLGEARGDAWSAGDGTTGELRSLRPGDRVRLTWRPPGRATDTTVQVAIRAAAGGTSVRFHHERLADAGEREAMRTRWKAALDGLAQVLAQ